MEINVIMEYFDKLNDENAMFIEFKDGGQLLVDNEDIIRANGDLIEIKSGIGCYITEIRELCQMVVKSVGHAECRHDWLQVHIRL